MGMGALAAATIGSSLIGANASNQAANTGAQSAANSAAVQQQMFNTVNQQQAPYRQAGYSALNQLTGYTGPGGSMTQPFTASDLNSYLAPNYQWQLQQGENALMNQQNLTGGVNSGNTATALQNWAQNYAGNAYQNAFNNYQTQQSNIFNRLASIAGLGQQSGQITANTGTQMAGNIGNAMIAGGQARAAGQMGVANALGSGLTNAASLYALPSTMNLGG